MNKGNDNRVDPLERLIRFYDAEGDRQGDESPRSTFHEVSKAKSTAPKLPKVVIDSDEYSSTLMMLRSTKEGVQQFGKQYSAINTILSLPASADLKRAVAMMYASPKTAEDISRSEWKRREDEYNEEKESVLRQQSEQLGRDRQLVVKELESLKEETGCLDS